MTRNKVKLELIANETARKTTYKKRKKGLLKKLDELTTLCGVDSCAVIYSPYEARPEVWPSPSGARRVLTRFTSLSKEDQGKKKLDHEAYLKQRIKKATQQLEKLRKDNRQAEMTILMHECLNGKRLEGLSLNDAMDLCFVIDKYLERIQKRVDHLEKMENNLNGDGPAGGSGSASVAGAPAPSDVSA